MSEDEFKDLIKFTSESIGPNRVRLSASVRLGASMHLDEKEMASQPKAVEFAKKDLTEMLLRKVYTDRRGDLRDAIMDLHKTRQGLPEYFEAVENILKLASRQ